MTHTYTVRMYGDTATADGDTQDTPIRTKWARELTFLVDITALAGTLDLEFQIYNPLTTKWHKLAEFDTFTSTGTDEGFIQYGIGQEIAVKYMISNSATFTVDAQIKE